MEGNGELWVARKFSQGLPVWGVALPGRRLEFLRSLGICVHSGRCELVRIQVQLMRILYLERVSEQEVCWVWKADGRCTTAPGTRRGWG